MNRKTKRERLRRVRRVCVHITKLREISHRPRFPIGNSYRWSTRLTSDLHKAWKFGQ